MKLGIPFVMSAGTKHDNIDTPSKCLIIKFPNELVTKYTVNFNNMGTLRMG